MPRPRLGAPMTWIETVPAEAATGRLKQTYERVGAKRGAVANIYQAMSLHPDALAANLELYTSIHFSADSPLSRREREIIATVVSRANGCAYCVSHHADALGRHAKEPGLQALVATDHLKAPLTPRERAMADHADKLTRQPGDVGPADVGALRDAGLSDREILDITLATAYFNFATRVATGLGVSLEDVDRAYEY